MDEPTPRAQAPHPPAAAPPTAPAVVAVVVAHDPGPWFEETMACLAAQDYPNLSILVVDAASATEVKPRVARSAPGAFVRRLTEHGGFGAAANEVLDVVEGAAFYLFCHDDIAPARDAVRLLVEEAFRSNAALVGPKLVAWDDPRMLLQVGEGIDHSGYVSPLVERGELDQEQHDAVRDVFALPGACTLVRADLFEAIGGFDEGIDLLYDDVSLCWRSLVAGGRVIVAPLARVRHLEALGHRRPVDDRRRLQHRHRLRVLLSCYSGTGLLLAVPRLVLLNLAEVAYALLVGRTAQARDIVSGWLWNLRRIDELREARRHVAAFRRVPDADVRRQMIRGSARLRQFVRGQIGGGEDRLSGLARSGRDIAGALRTGSLRTALTVWAAVALVLAAGSRHLITRGVPAVGELVTFSSSPLDLLRAWFSGWRTAGLGSESPAPTAFGILGGLGLLAGGTMGMLRTLLTVGMIPLGALFAYRLPAPTGSRLAQVAALLVYVCNPLPYNALAAGSWSALVLYGGLPLMIGILARAGDLAPFVALDGTTRGAVRPMRFRQRVLALGLVTALMAAFVPSVVFILVGVAVGLALGSVLALRTRGVARMLGAGVGGALVAVVLHAPWSFDFIVPGTPLSAVMGPPRAAEPSDLAALLRFSVGPLGSGILGWVFVVAAALPLLIGRNERHAWAVRGWALAITSWGVAWAVQRGDVPVAMPPVEVLLVPAAIGLALAAAMGVVAFQVDLPGYRFGWRQIASGVAALAVALGTVPVLGAAFDGRWSMPAGDHERALGFIDAQNDDEPFRVLWVGDPAVLPLGSWELDDGLAYATSDAGTPRAEDLWVGSDDGRTGLVADALELARSGQTARLGRLLAPMGVRYVILPEQLAPAPFAEAVRAVPGGLLATLDAQLDLEPLDTPAGLRVYRNQASIPVRAAVPSGTPLPEAGSAPRGLAPALALAPVALPDSDGLLEWSGPVEAGTTVLQASSHSDRWQLSVDGEGMEHLKPYGWANGFVVARDGDATLRFRTPATRYGILVLQALAWLWAFRTVMRARLGPQATGEAA